MKIIRSYSGMGRESLLPAPSNAGDQEQGQKNQQQKSPKVPGGDSVTLSEQAREALEIGQEALNAQAVDATYDQHGNVLRQFESVQGELRNLAASFMASEDGSMLGKVRSMQSQLRSLRAMV